jgi:hypothetical protein
MAAGTGTGFIFFFTWKEEHKVTMTASNNNIFFMNNCIDDLYANVIPLAKTIF